MKIFKILPILALAAVVAGCNKPAGELVGAGQNGNFQEADPMAWCLLRRVVSSWVPIRRALFSANKTTR